MFQQIARFCLYTVPLTLILVLPGTFFPFIGGKYFAFRFLITLATVAVTLGWAFENEPFSLKERFWPVLKSPATIGFMFLTGAVLLATAFAYDPVGAFWSNYERAEGSFQFIHYLLFFVLMGGLFTERKHWKTMMWTSIVASIGVAGYGVLSAISPTAFLGPYGGLTGNFVHKLFSGSAYRFQGSLGNAAYVTPYFVFIAGYMGWLWHNAQTRVKAAFFGVLGLLFSAVFFALSQTRGAFLGFVAGFGVAAIYYAWRRPNYRKWVIGIIVAGAVVFGGLFAFRNNPHIAALPGSRFLQIDLTQVTAQTRLWTWHQAWLGFKDRPVFGYGPENFPVVFDKHFDPRHFNPTQNSETWFDRAHDIVFDYLAETGIVGFLAWLSFIVLVFVQIRRVIRQHALSTFEEALLLGLPVMYIVQSLVLFDVLPIIMNLIMVAALALCASFWRPHGDKTVINANHRHVRAH